MQNPLFSASCIVAILTFSACNSGINSGKETSEAKSGVELMVADSAAGSDGTQQVQIPLSPNQPLPDTVIRGKMNTPLIPWDKKIIKTGELSLETKSMKGFTDGLHLQLAKHGAYIAKEESTQSESYRAGNWVIKVPVLQFEDLMNSLPGKDGKLTARNINSDDVTTAWFDTRSRLEAKRQMKLKYAEFLAKAKNMEEVLQVQQEINRLQEEIESATGRINSLGAQSAYSTINLHVTEVGAGMRPVDEVPGVFTRLTMAFKSGADGFAYLLVGLVSVWPLLLVAAVAVYFFRRKNSKPLPAKQ